MIVENVGVYVCPFLLSLSRLGLKWVVVRHFVSFSFYFLTFLKLLIMNISLSKKQTETLIRGLENHIITLKEDIAAVEKYPALKQDFESQVKELEPILEILVNELDKI